MSLKWQYEASLDDGNVLYLNCINDKIMVVTLYYIVQEGRCYHCGKLAKGFMRSSYIISYNYM